MTPIVTSVFTRRLWQISTQSEGFIAFPLLFPRLIPRSYSPS